MLQEQEEQLDGLREARRLAWPLEAQAKRVQTLKSDQEAELAKTRDFLAQAQTTRDWWQKEADRLLELEAEGRV